jgi:glycine cleavage system aminomethyltransferase T
MTAVAHYGSVATELAICRKTAGLADRSELGRLELTGREPWIEHALAHAIGPAVPQPGRAARLGDTWCCRVAPDRALIVAPEPALARWRRLAREAVVAGHPIACADGSRSTAAVSLVGPSAAAVLRLAGLPYGPEVGDLAAGEDAIVLRDGPQQFLLLPGAPIWDALLDAGRPLGLSPVGSDAIVRLRAVSR